MSAPDRSSTGSEIPQNFGYLLAVTVTSFLVTPFGTAEAPVLLDAVNGAFIVAAFASTGLRAVVSRFRSLVAIAVLTGTAVVFRGVADSGSDLVAAAGLVQASVLTLMVFAVLAAVLRHQVISTQTIIGAITAYLLIGMAFGSLYLAMDTFDEGQISISSDDPSAFSEFSFVVQTTLGFGDVTPTGSLAARVVALHAVLGQVFLATFVARLVSLYGRRRDHGADDADEP